MIDLQTFLKEIISAPGLSGYEESVRKIIQETWTPLADEISVSRVGSLHAFQRGTGSEPRPSILFATHMDAIGLMVSKVVDGFLRVAEIGGLDPRVLPGQIVTIHGREDLPGVIVQPPNRLLPRHLSDKAVPLMHLWVDTGLSAEEMAGLVRPGDLISFAQPPIEMGDGELAGHSLDNRASVAALTLCLEELRHRPHNWDVWGVATAQEEETFAGAYTSAFQIRPTLAIAVDVTFAAGAGSPSHRTFNLGEGPTLGFGPNVHSGLHRSFKEMADRMEIPVHLEPMPRYSGTDAMALQVVAEGIPTMVVSIPLRYMHTPVEMVALKDIRRAARLMAEFAATLAPDFVEQLSWDD